MLLQCFCCLCFFVFVFVVEDELQGCLMKAKPGLRQKKKQLYDANVRSEEVTWRGRGSQKDGRSDSIREKGADTNNATTMYTFFIL